VRREAGVAELAAAGIDHVVSTDREGWQDRVAALTAGAPIRCGIESVGGTAAADMLSLLAPGGRLVSFGSMSGAPLAVPSAALIFRRITIEGFWGAARAAATPPAEMARMIGELVALAAKGELRLSVDERFGLADAARAAAASARPGRSGKVALMP